MAGPETLRSDAPRVTPSYGTDGSWSELGDRNNGLGDIWKRISPMVPAPLRAARKFVARQDEVSSDYIGNGKSPLRNGTKTMSASQFTTPARFLVDGYGNQMPTFQGQLNDRRYRCHLIGMMEHLEEFDSADRRPLTTRKGVERGPEARIEANRRRLASQASMGVTEPADDRDQRLNHLTSPPE